MSEITLTEIPTAVVTFYHDHQELKIPAIALASGSGLYIYKNMKPYYRFSLPDLEVSPLEMDLWIQVILVILKEFYDFIIYVFMFIQIYK